MTDRDGELFAGTEHEITERERKLDSEIAMTAIRMYHTFNAAERGRLTIRLRQLRAERLASRLPKYPQTSGLSGAVQKKEVGKWKGGVQPSYPDGEVCEKCGCLLRLGEVGVCVRCPAEDE